MSGDQKGREDNSGVESSEKEKTSKEMLKCVAKMLIMLISYSI